MGEVNRAKDPKLGRGVAIKVLPRELAQGPDRVGRFQREAKLLASLNHPNIAAICGLEESGGSSDNHAQLSSSPAAGAGSRAGRFVFTLVVLYVNITE